VPTIPDPGAFPGVAAVRVPGLEHAALEKTLSTA